MIGSCGFFSSLTIVFIVLKLCGCISWSWLAVFSPMLIGIVFTLFIFAVFVYLGSKF